MSELKKGARVRFDISRAVGLCGQRGQKPDGHWTGLVSRGRMVRGTVFGSVKPANPRENVLGAGLYVSESLDELLIVKLDAPFRAWATGPDFAYAAIHEDATATLWRRIKARVHGRRLRRERF